MTQTQWPAPVGITVKPMPNDPAHALAHLVTDHGWEPRVAEVSMIQAHRYAHGIDGRPDFADSHVNHIHSGPVSSARGGTRPLTWVILAWNLLMFIWILYGLGTTGNQLSGCASEIYRDACEAGTTIGGGIAIIGILFLTAVVDVILAVIWHVTKKDDR